MSAVENEDCVETKLWSDLVRQLDIPDDFIGRHDATIQDRLVAAADELTKGRDPEPIRGGDPTAGTFVDADFRGITQSLQVARSALLVGAAPQSLKVVLERVAGVAGLSGHDPATITTVAVLYFLVRRILSAPERERSAIKKIELIHRRFDELNWMTSPGAMATLGISPLD